MSLTANKLQKTITEKLENRPGVRKVISNFGWLFWDRLIRMGLGLLIACWMARSLGPAQYGMLNWAASWVTIFNTISVLGLDRIVMRDVIKFPEETSRILGTAFTMKLVGSVVMIALSLGILVGAGSRIGSNSAQLQILVALLATSYLFTALDTIDFWYQAQIASRNVVYAKSVSFFLISALKLWLLHVHASVIAFAATVLIEGILSAVGLYVSYVSNRQSIRSWKYDKRWAKSMLADSWPVMLSTIALALQTRIDQVMLGVMVNQSEVGQFSAAVGMIENFAFIPTIIQTTVAPVIVKAKLVSEDIYYARLGNLYRLMFLSFVVIAVPLFFVAKPVVVFFLGAKYAAAGTLLALLGLRLFFANLGAARGVFVMTENLYRYTMITSALGSVANIVLNYLLIPHYGAVGSIWAMIASLFITIFAVDFIYAPVRRNLRTMLWAVATPWKLSFH